MSLENEINPGPAFLIAKQPPMRAS